MADEEGGWHGWQDDNGNAMFVADGRKVPVLVRVTGHGEHEMVLADFTSVEAAGVFQDWLDQSFEGTALANQRLSMQVRGVRPGLVPDEEMIEAQWHQEPEVHEDNEAYEAENYRGPRRGGA